ncbi:MAG: tetratricopeptide repeat protein [Cyanobacteria bacterium SZAS TMP-1]|nr:tetratricopeptide repeat protein [Cyanobacteria bacterium SZAS TMP-1]
MSYKRPWSRVSPISRGLGRHMPDGDNRLTMRADDNAQNRPQPQASWVNWNKPALGARIAYQMGEVKTAIVIIENCINEINGWLPTELKVFAVLLYKARLAFYNGDLDAAEACYQWAYEMMTEYRMEGALGSTAAELYDEWGECLVLLGFNEEALERYQMAVETDLACHEANPRLMSPWRLAKLADFFAVQGAATHSKLCMELAEAKAESPVEKMYVRTFCVSAIS